MKPELVASALERTTSAKDPSKRMLEVRREAEPLSEERRHEAAIAVTEIVGYEAVVSTNEEDARAMVSQLRRIAGVAGPHGRLAEAEGHHVVREFGDAGSALWASERLARSFRGACAVLGLPEGKIRTGIHFGPVAKRKTDGRIFGDAVEIARRLQELARPRRIVVSQPAADQLGIELEDLGERHFGGMLEPVRCSATSLPAAGAD